MNFENIKKYLSVFILGVALIAVYKTFDNLGNIFNAVRAFLSMLSPIVYSFGIAFLLYPLCLKAEGFLQKSKIGFLSKRSRGISVLLIYTAVTVALAGVFYILVPVIVTSLMDFIQRIPWLIEDVSQRLNRSPYFSVDNSKVYAYIERFLSESNMFKLNLYTSKIINISNGLINIILIYITSIYILLDRESLIGFARAGAGLLLPSKKRAFLKKYAKKALYFTHKYFYCIFADAAIVFVLALVIFYLMGIEYAPVLALMLGLFNIIPYFGAIVASVIAIILTILTGGISKGLILAAVLLALQQIDANVIQPHIIKGSLSVKPFWVLAGLFIGGGLFGIWGIILAVPVMAFIRSIALDYIDYRNTKNTISKNPENNKSQ